MQTARALLASFAFRERGYTFATPRPGDRLARQAPMAALAVPAATLLLRPVCAKGRLGTCLSAIAHADPTLLGIATLANHGTLVVKGIRWALFLRAVGIHGTGQALRVTFVGHALNNVLIANGGDAVRVAAMARLHRVSSAKVLATLAIDRLCDLVSYAALFVVAAFALPLPPELARWRTPGILALAAIGVAVTALVLRGPRKPPREQLGESDGETLLSRARDYWHRLSTTSAELATAPRLAAAVALAFVAWQDNGPRSLCRARGVISPRPPIAARALVE
jgi:uncharacterized membrane protein YbhN (UPF0104 family)